MWVDGSWFLIFLLLGQSDFEWLWWYWCNHMVICKPYGLIDGTNQHSFLLGSFGEVFGDLIFANIYIDHLSTPGGFYGDTVPCQQQMKCYCIFLGKTLNHFVRSCTWVIPPQTISIFIGRSSSWWHSHLAKNNLAPSGPAQNEGNLIATPQNGRITVNT